MIKKGFVLLLCTVLWMMVLTPGIAEGGYMNLVGYLTQEDVLNTEHVTIKDGDDVKVYDGMVLLIANLRGEESGCRLVGLNEADEPESLDFYMLPEMTVLKTIIILCQNWETVSGWMNEDTKLVIMVSVSEDTNPVFITDETVAASFAETMVRYLVFD